MEITPYKNGIHSLAGGLRCLKQFLDDSDDTYLMKDVVLKTHHGLETLFKDLLFQRNPVFLLVDKTNVGQILDFYKGFHEGKNDYLFDEAKTITPEETIIRIKELKIIEGVSSKDYRQLSISFKTLNAVRNQLQHFAIKAKPDSIIRVLGNLIPRSVALLKRCYKMNGQNQYQPRVNLIPHQALPGMEQLFGKKRNIENDLNNIFPEAVELIRTLETKYDLLLNEAINKFKKAVLKSLALSIKIRDLGHCGAPPYYPEFTLEGWMNEKLEPHRNSMSNSFFRQGETISALYDSSMTVETPEIIKAAVNWHDEAETRLKMFSESTISIINPDGFFDIPEFKEYIPFIKEPKIRLLLNLECISQGMFNDSHFDIKRILDLSGEVKIELSSSVYGDVDNCPSVLGVQVIKLNASNTSLNFHAFVQSNKTLKDNYSLEIQIEDVADLEFK